MTTKKQVRTFLTGLALGVVVGAFAVSTIVWRYGNVIGSRAASLEHPANPPAAVARWHDGVEEEADVPVLVRGEPAATIGTAPVPPPAADAPAIGPAPHSPGELQDRDLVIPVDGIKPEQLTRSFEDLRGSRRRHEAIDILAPRNTPVKAVEDGTIARLFYSKAGGTTIYQFDPTERFCYYYAHLERYAEGLSEGDKVRKGQVIGYVGTSGNAPPGTPHLHFAVFRLSGEKRWWEGTPIDPYDVLR